jgi:hypothetical protein
MKLKLNLLSILLSFFLAPSLTLFAQEADSTVSREDAVKVFIDCYHCDMDFVRNEIPYINYVRDVREAEVYIRESVETAASGGRKYTYVFLGQNRFDQKNDTLVYFSRPDDTRDLRRVWRTQMMKMGLMSYVAHTPLYKEIEIVGSENIEKEVVIDRWNNWVFEIETEPSFEGEEARQELDFWTSVSAVKINHEMKLEFDFDHRLSKTFYTYDNEDYSNKKDYKSLDLLAVKSLGEHWSAGIKTDFLSSTYNNYKFATNILPALEYNIFPYSESTHKQLRILYAVGSSIREYNDSTIYDKLSEKLFSQQIHMAFQVQEKWGSVNIALEGSNYFHDLSKNRIELNGYVSLRVLKGLSLRVGGAAARINDQLSLVKGEASEAEILLQLQELQTAYNIEGEIAVTYTFGSIYNNIVNPRFGNGRRRF